MEEGQARIRVEIWNGLMEARGGKGGGGGSCSSREGGRERVEKEETPSGGKGAKIQKETADCRVVALVPKSCPVAAGEGED